MLRLALPTPSAPALATTAQRRLQPVALRRTPGACAAAAAAAAASRRVVRVQAGAQPPQELGAGGHPRNIKSTSSASTSSQGSSRGSCSRGTAAAMSAAALLLPLAHPETAAAAAAAAAHIPAIEEAYWMSLGVGTVGVVTTLLLTSRFLMSFFPELEKQAKQRPSKVLLLRALTLADPVLDPVTKGLFRMTESGDLNYGAMFLLALSSGVLATLLGDGGPMVHVVPDLTLLQGLRYLVYFQHMVLLPMWVFVVFRYFLLI